MIKVALVEDDPSMRRLLSVLLDLEGFQVFAYGISIEEILNGLETDCPDVLLLDYHLSQLSGLDVLHCIKQNKQIRTLRIIMTSGMDVQDCCLQAGADGFIFKPFMPDDLIALLRQQV